MYEIHKGVEIPAPARKGSTSRRKYQFEEMDVGDMFFAPDKDPQSLSTWAARVGKKLNRKFSVRTIYTREEGGKLVICDKRATGATKGVGVWRVQ